MVGDEPRDCEQPGCHARAKFRLHISEERRRRSRPADVLLCEVHMQKRAGVLSVLGVKFTGHDIEASSEASPPGSAPA